MLEFQVLEIVKQDYSVEGTKELVKTVATSLNNKILMLLLLKLIQI